MSLTLTVHRGTRQIGGSCIEIAHPAGDRLILDAGRPLDAPDGATGLLPASLDTSCAATVLISHPHQDHWGLVDDLPADWPIWTGAGSAKLIEITGDIMRRPLARQFKTWTSRSGPFAIGPFTVTPILTDHSATTPTCCSSRAPASGCSTRETSAATAASRASSIAS